MKKTLLLILILSWTTACFGKMHIHTDASDYRAGERIWFRIHMLDAHTLMPDTVTSLVIVELINPQGDVTKRVKLLRDNGVFCGYLDIPGTAEAGQYLVRSYLRGMTDMDYAGKQIVYIHGKPSDEQLSGEPYRSLSDSVPVQHVSMPLDISAQDGIYRIRIGTDSLQPFERVMVSASVTDRYAIASHAQWTILQTFQSAPVTRAELNDITDSVLLDEIEVNAKRLIKESDKELHSMHMADVSFGMNKIEEYSATCLHDLLRRVPGVYVKDEKCYIRGAHSIYANNPATIAINGVLQDGDYDLDLIPMQDIARLDIFKSGTMVVWGPRGGAGVISIILKDGSEIPRQTDQSNLKKFTPLGWQQPQEFYMQPYPGNGKRPTTLLWIPDVQSQVMSFSTDRHATIYDVVIEGATSNGRLIREHQTIQSSR